MTPIRLYATATDTSSAAAANRRLSIDVDPAYILAALIRNIAEIKGRRKEKRKNLLIFIDGRNINKSAMSHGESTRSILVSFPYQNNNVWITAAE